MNTRRSLLILIPLLIISACNRPQKDDVTDLTQDAQLERFFEPDIVESELATFLHDEFGLTSASVDFDDEVIKLYLEQPEALSDEQLMLIYLGSLDAAARFAPASEKVKLTIAVGGDPFIVVQSDTEQINAYRRGEIDLTAFVGQLTIDVPDNGSLEVAADRSTDSSPTPTPILEVDLSVSLVSIVFSEHQGWRVYAILSNVGSTLVAEVSAQVDVYDEEGSLITSETAWVMQSTIQPGSSSVLVVEIEGEQIPAEAEVSQPEAEYVFQAEALELSQGADRSIMDAENGRVVLVSELINQGSDAIVVDSTLGLLLNKRGEVLAHVFDYEYAPQLLPGESTPISIGWYNIDPTLMDQVAALEILPEVRLARSERQSSLSISTSTRVFFDHNGWPHMVGLLRNEGELPERPVLLGALLDSSGQILDCQADWGEPPVVLPGMTVPFDLDFWPFFSVAPEMSKDVATFDLRVDAYNSYAPQAYEINLVEDYQIEWNVKDGEVLVEGVAQVASDQYNDVLAIMTLRDIASGEIIAADHAFFYGEGSEVTLYEYIPYDPAFDPNEADLSVDVYAVKLIG